MSFSFSFSLSLSLSLFSPIGAEEREKIHSFFIGLWRKKTDFHWLEKECTFFSSLEK